MMQKFFVAVGMALFILLFQASIVSAADVSIDTTQVSNGIVRVTCSDAASKTIKALVEKGSEKYQYTIPNGSPVTMPLQMGSGEYKISVLEGVGGNQYKYLKTETVNASSINELSVYKNSIQPINFNNNMTSMKELSAIAAGGGSTEDKIAEVYKYIIKNFSYDYDKAANIVNGSIDNGYIPVIDSIYSVKKGICYDYSSLFAAALRNIGIPAKLQMGYSKDVSTYHAWNEVYINNQWVKIDTTYDSQADKASVSYSMVKDNGNFQVLKQY